MHQSLVWILAAILLGCGVGPLFGQPFELNPSPWERFFRSMMDNPVPTMGGKQFWADELHFRDWRIQQNVVTGHFRLLDGRDFRHAWGSYENCLARLQAIRREQDLTPWSGKCVVLLHGLGRSRASMAGIGEYLREQGGYHVYNVTYPSTRNEIAAHAARLARLIERLEGATEIHFVGHSMGNIVVRRYLADQLNAAEGRRPDGRLRRMVMLAPPNSGADLARDMAAVPLADAVIGEPLAELGEAFDRLKPTLVAPDEAGVEFGIIAGGRGAPWGRNPILEGDDDLVLRVEETRLPGARDFLVQPVTHTFLMDDARVRACTLRFLQYGYFVSEEARQPIPRPDARDPP